MNTILLAAGFSRRMGTHKLLLPWKGGTILSSVVDSLLAAEFKPIILVSTQYIISALSPLPSAILPCINRAADLGQAESLKMGLRYLIDREDFSIMLGDLPLVQEINMRLCIEMFKNRPSGKTALIPYKDGYYGHPAIFSYIWKKRFQTLYGDKGGRSIIEKNKSEIMVHQESDVYFKDVDTPEEYCKYLGITP